MTALGDKSIEWQNAPPLNGTVYPVGREGHLLVYSEHLNMIVMFGGMSADRCNDIFTYSVEKASWTEIKATGNQPQARCYTSGFVFANYLVIYGGQGDKSRSLGDMYILDLESKRWRKTFFLEAPIARYRTGLANDEKGEMISSAVLHHGRDQHAK